MVAACTSDGVNYSLASDRLKRDPDVVRAAFDSGVPGENIVFQVPLEVYEQHRDIVTLAIESVELRDLSDDEKRRLYNAFGAEAFTERSVFLSWMQKGWSLPPNVGPW